MDNELHDGHSTHFDGVAPLTKPQTNNYNRAIALNRESILYPARVRVYSAADAIDRAQTARELAL